MSNIFPSTADVGSPVSGTIPGRIVKCAVMPWLSAHDEQCAAAETFVPEEKQFGSHFFYGHTQYKACSAPYFRAPSIRSETGNAMIVTTYRVRAAHSSRQLDNVVDTSRPCTRTVGRTCASKRPKTRQQQGSTLVGPAAGNNYFFVQTAIHVFML